MIITCNNCNKEFNRKPSHVRTQNFCSRPCKFSGYKYTDTQRNRWAEAAKVFHTGRKDSLETRARKSLSKMGVKHPSWGGDSVGYASLHEWIARNFGKPSKCEHCNTEVAKRFEWANKGNYTRNREDWIRLCSSCHKTYDGIVFNIKRMRKVSTI